MDRFVLRVSSINDYEKEIANFSGKYNSVGLAIQPFIIAEWAADSSVKSIYVYFSKTLHKFSSFIIIIYLLFITFIYFVF